MEKEENENILPLDINYSDNNVDNNMKKESQKGKIKVDKKLTKKLAKGLNVLVFHEQKPVKLLISDVPTINLWIYHFGNGDEDDQNRIKEYFENNYGHCKVYIFPGISYGFIEMSDLAHAEKVIPINDDITKENNKKYNEIKKNAKSQSQIEKDEDFSHVLYNSHTLKFENGERTIFSFYSKVSLPEVVQNKESAFPIAHYKVDVPGLYIFDEFITPEEESKLLEEINNREWHKLSSRRVQHYGYEFVYGKNNIDKNKKIGDLPEFFNELMERKFYYNN
jgi:alkylated DNA repair protein alkB family protein 8